MDTSKEYIAMCDCPEILKASRRHRDSMSFWRDANYPEFIGSPKAVWLPRQDQLQKMVDWKKWKRKHQTIQFGANGLYDKFRPSMLVLPPEGEQGLVWCSDNSMTSMEQLWLAFVMWELHQKKWDGGKWV